MLCPFKQIKSAHHFSRLFSTALCVVGGTASKPEYDSILTDDAKAFLECLHRKFEPRRKQLLVERVIVQQRIDSGWRPTFIADTEHIRQDPKWRVAEPAPALTDRRVEITGPVDRKMVINALNSGATQFMADFEDANSPTWTNCMDGQVNLRDAVNGTISLLVPQTGKSYKLNSNIATLLVRPRGWHLIEKHVTIDNQPISASLFDFGLYFFHNAKKSIEKGFGPYFYLPKMESHFEAKLWNDVFDLSQKYVGIPRGTIRATCLIETVLAAFQMEEILYELRDHSAGLNCGRWDYIFSIIKKFGKFSEFVLPDRSQVTMTTAFMDAYVRLLIHACHKRGAHAMGGMAAQIPIKSDAKLNDEAMSRVREDKLREVRAGHDGTWVAHPDLVAVAKHIFDHNMVSGGGDEAAKNQLCKNTQLDEITVNRIRENLLNVVSTHGVGVNGVDCTELGLRNNIAVSLIYLDAWLNGLGCVPINNLMEDAATAEISRSQIWQWLTHSTPIRQTVSGETKGLTKQWLIELIDEESRKLSLRSEQLSKTKLYELVFADKCPEFLTSLCYDHIN